jgi:ADP-ribose pyrophosphatase YjhB (NUDIX family)
VHRGHEHEIFLTPRDRAAGIGIAVVTTEVVATEQEEKVAKAFLGIRSGKVGTYPATNHVVPAGMCNTYGTNYEVTDPNRPPPPDYLETVMRCEFLEEWAQATEFESNKRREWANLVNHAWEEQIERLVTAPLRLTGVAFDLLNLRPEVCATISVDMHHGALNWEFDQIGVERPLRDMGVVQRTEIVQGGAAALKLAQLAEEKEPQGAVVPAARSEALGEARDDGWIPEDEYKAIMRKVPILCVDLLPLNTDRNAVGLILRETYEGKEGWCLIGGAVHRDEDLLTAVRRHLRDTLGKDFVADLTHARPLTTAQYFSEPNLGELYDPRKHAVALTYGAPCSGPHKTQGEAKDFRWVALDELPNIEFGFGQGRVVEGVLAQLGLRDRRS